MIPTEFTPAGGRHTLRWTGSLADLFQFEVVGNLASEAAKLALHDGRLFATVQPNAVR
jgi:hypothetical protein